MKRFLCVVMILCLLLSFVGCVKTPIKLDTPADVKASRDALLSWSAVSNATSYVVTVEGQQYTVTDTQFQSPVTTRSFTFTVVATAEGFAQSDEATATFTYVPSIIVPPVDKPTVAIVGSSEVHSGGSVTLKAKIDGVVSKDVAWSVVEGKSYVSVDGNGVVTALEATSDHIVKIRATVTRDDADSVYAEHVMTVSAPTKLTQDMLDAFNNVDKVGFEGYMEIALYNPGATGDVLQGTYVNTVQTAMDGENWFASYDGTGTGVSQRMHVKKKDGLAQQISVSLMNDEEYFPIKDSDGLDETWQNAGLYNSFKNLSVADFTFDRETWRWTYSGSSDTFVQRVISSANPYEFEPTNLSLIIEDGEVMGIHSKSKPSYSVVQGYKAVLDLFVVLNVGDVVEIPTIAKYQHDDKVHDELQTAIDNMRALTTYKTEFTQTVYAQASPNGQVSGYEEIVTPNECFFKGYDVVVRDGKVEHDFIKGQEYGFRKFSDSFYNSYSFNGDDGKFQASRAYNGSFSEAKPTFAFASELFRAYSVDEETDETTYYVDEIMCHVATTWYKAPGTDMALYGLFATNYYYTIERFLPYVTVKNGYITETGFFFNLGEMYGTVQIKYGDFNTARLPQDHSETVAFERREIPVSWSQLEIQVSDGDTTTAVPRQADEFLAEKFGATNVVPFFGSVLGDAYGFGLTTTYRPVGSNQMREAVVFYYDVPLDADYTINSSINTVKKFLVENGFVQGSNGDFAKGNLRIAPIDQSLDFVIYVWTV